MVFIDCLFKAAAPSRRICPRERRAELSAGERPGGADTGTAEPRGQRGDSAARPAPVPAPVRQSRRHRGAAPSMLRLLCALLPLLRLGHGAGKGPPVYAGTGQGLRGAGAQSSGVSCSTAVGASLPEPDGCDKGWKQIWVRSHPPKFILWCLQ